jgi:uncharacterized protein (TIGR04168 family)
MCTRAGNPKRLLSLDYQANKMCQVDSEHNLSVGQGGDAGSFQLMEPFYRVKFDIGSLAESQQKIYENLTATDRNNPVVVIAHNGPYGLGSRAEDLVGKDFEGHGSGVGGT